MNTVRKSIFPSAQDTWESIAARELSSSSTKEGIANLQSWNLHVFARPPAPAESPRAGNPILPSDILFIEPPLA